MENMRLGGKVKAQVGEQIETLEQKESHKQRGNNEVPSRKAGGVGSGRLCYHNSG